MTHEPLSYLDASGAAAAPLTQLAWGLGAISVAVVAIISVALIWAIARKRPAQPDGPDSLSTQVSQTAGLKWIYFGVGISTVILAGCTVWTLAVLGRVMHPAQKPELTLQVIAHQWWWEVRYPASADGAPPFTTANEIHIPTGQPVRFELSSRDVIHSFWVPKLGGKMDLIPGVTNATWLEASSPGDYWGQCGEFCGIQHAHMAFRVIADTPGDFAVWQTKQLAAHQAPPSVAAGSKVFQERCSGCHTVAGTPAGGVIGPDLSHLASRSTLAAGLIPNDSSHLSDWIANPQAIKPGVLMPAVALTETQRNDVVAYLEALS